MSIGFAVVMIQIVDGGAGSIWALNFSHITFEHITTYTGIVILSLGIQVFLLFITSRIVFKIRKASSRRALIIPYIYVISQAHADRSDNISSDAAITNIRIQ